MKYFSQNILVSKDAIDVNNHVNNVMYIQWMQDIAISHSEFVGDTLKVQEERGYMWVVKTHTINYMASAYEDETLQVKTWVEHYKKSACLRRYEFYNQEQTLLARSETIYVCVDIKNFRPKKIPEDIYELYV